jgi:exodeoxyribonuclease-3
VFDELGWVDVFRRLHPDATEACYTWWSNRGQAWAKNVGWRIDYQIATRALLRRRCDPKSTRRSVFRIMHR